jgi:phosphoribosyl-dephospho-CoA transferase
VESVIAAVHDIVALSDGAVRRIARSGPAWVATSLERAPFAVVRRERRDAVTCIGVRGAQRAQRHAAEVGDEDISKSFSPETLLRVPAPRVHPVFRALEDVAAILSEYDVRWGPAGAAGFELATGARVLHDRSDLDIVLRLEPNDARVLPIASALRKITVRVDAELCFGDDCGAALEEAARSGPLLVKTPLGPCLLSVMPT